MSYLSYAETAAGLDSQDELPMLAKPLVAGGLAIRHAAQSLVNGTASLVGLDGPWDESQEAVEKMYGRTIGKFYGDNQAGIDLVGEVGALFAPGFGAAKAMTFLSKAAETSKILKYYNVLDAAGYQRKFENAAKLAAQGTEEFGDYTKVWSATRKAYAAGAVAAVQESAAMTAVSYAFLKDTNLFEDYTMKDFAVESLFGGAIGVGFKYFGTRKLAKEAIGDSQRAFQEVNFVPSEVKGLDPNLNLINMFVQRGGKAFTDDTSRLLFVKAASDAAKKLVPDEVLHPALDKYIQNLAELSGRGSADAVPEIARFAVGLKSIQRVGAPSEKLVSYIDTRTGMLTDSVAMGAAERGVKLMNNQARVGEDIVTPNMFFNDLSQMDAAHADALHMLAVRAGRTGDMFKPTKEILNEKGKPLKAAFREDNVFHLAAAREYAAKNGKAALVDGRGNLVELSNVEDIAKRQLYLNDELGAKLMETGHTNDAISLKLNSDVLDGPNAKYRYTGLTDAELTTPRFLQVEYDFANVAEREVGLAGVAQKSMEEIRRAKLSEGPEAVAARLGIKTDALPDEITGFGTMMDAPRLLGFGAQGKSGGFRNQIEQVGSMTENNGRAVAEKLVTTIQSKIAPLLRNQKDRVEWATYKNLISANPAKLKLKVDGDVGYIIDRETDDVLKIADKYIPSMTGNVLKAFQIEMQELHPNVVDMYNSLKKFDGNHGAMINKDLLYAAPITDAPFMAMVKYRNGTKRMIHAQSDDSLKAQIAEVKVAQKAFVEDIVLKGDIKLQKELQGIFEPGAFFSNMEADISAVRTGAAAAPLGTNGDDVLNRMINYYDGFGRAAALHYTKRRYEPVLNMLGKQQERLDISAGSVLGKKPGSWLGENADEYKRLQNVMLGKTNVGSYEAFAKANATVNEVFAKGYETFARGFKSILNSSSPIGSIARKIPYTGNLQKEYNLANSELADHLNKFVSQFGLHGTDYKNVAQQLVLNSSHSPLAATKLVTGMNGFFATGQLGLDVLNTAVNFLSFPLTQIPEFKNLRKNLLTGNVEGLEGIAIKDPTMGGKWMLSPHKMLENVHDVWMNPSKHQAKWQQFVDQGSVTPQTMAYQLAHENLGKSFASRDPNIVEKAWGGFLDTARTWLVDKPNNFMQFVSAHAADDVLLRAGVTDAKLRATRVAQHVRRTQHNFVGSQRPILFNGPIGSAVSLYQTFQFNTIQNLTRYMGEGDKKAIGVFMGLQTGMFGLQSNPIFHAANSMIAYKNGNTERNDLYTRLQDADSLLYGPISSLLNVNLYGRGDLTPRTAILLPTEVANIPAIAQSIKLGSAIGNIIDGVATMGPGGEPSRAMDSFLTAVQQSGLNRGLAGLAATFQGQSLDAQGNKIADTEPFSFATVMRAAGGRPFDEAKLRDLQYRTLAYQAKDNKLLEELGQDYRSQIRTYGDFDMGTWTTFVQKYSNAGGEMKNLQRWLVRNNEKAGSNVAARLAKRYENDPDMQPWLKWIATEASGDSGE